MARVTYGAFITELTGSIGGITFQRNSSGTIARAKPNMIVNPSANQSVQQNFLARLVAAWPSLSGANKTSWSNFAAAHDHVNEWNEIKVLNGFQWFLSCNLNLLVCGLATINTAPAWTVLAPIQQFDLVADENAIALTWENMNDFTGFRLLTYATPPIRQSSMKLRRSTWFLEALLTGELNFYSIEDLYSEVLNVWWPDIWAAADCTIIIRCKIVEEGTGLASPYTSNSIKIN